VRGVAGVLADRRVVARRASVELSTTSASARGSGQRGRMRRQPRGSDHSSERMRERGSRIGEEEALVEEKTPSPSTPNLRWPSPCVPARWLRPATPSPCRVAAAAPISTAAPHGFFLCVCDSDRLPRVRSRTHVRGKFAHGAQI